jgi:tRNA-splicing ligase RtcB
MESKIFQQIDQWRFLIPKDYKAGMLVGGIIYSSEELLQQVKNDNAYQQVANVAFLPGIVKYSLAMPDIHWGYGFPIGGVAATDIDKGGVISPGGVGFDINCGVRLVRTNLEFNSLKPKLASLADCLYKSIPSGLGSVGSIVVNRKQMRHLLAEGLEWARRQGWVTAADLDACEERGSMSGADPDKVSPRAYKRGRRQVGTLGSGNHFLEVQVVDKIFDQQVASELGVFKNQITLMIHSGSRGLGYQVCSDYLKPMLDALAKHQITIPDKQLACAPFNCRSSQDYFAAMKAAANYAWVNRAVLTYLARESFTDFFGRKWTDLGMDLIYDNAHNIAKIEDHLVDGAKRRLCVHRKGATRCFGPGNKYLQDKYNKIGQPVIIPGDMGRASFLMIGQSKAEQETFGSTAHGAGRVRSRKGAIKSLSSSEIFKFLESKGVQLRAAGKKTILEEAPDVYKDIEKVVEVISGAGISQKVARMLPLCVIKG